MVDSLAKVYYTSLCLKRDAAGRCYQHRLTLRLTTHRRGGYAESYNKALLLSIPDTRTGGAKPMTNENKALQWAMLICLLSMAAGTLALVAIVGGAL